MKSFYQYAKRNFSKSVYIWTAMPKIGPKAAEMKQALTIPKGIPKRIEALDDKGVKKLIVGQRHSAVITGIHLNLNLSL